ncbi:MAG: ATP-binding protein, partial [Chloroflexales bacterium]
GVPMIFGERMIGMITLNKYTPDFYTTEHTRLAMAFAAQAAAAMENARLYAAARRELAERHRAEEAQARLAAIIEATTDMVGMTDLQGQSLFLNQAGRRLMGLSDAVPLAGLHMAEFFPMRLRGALRDEILPATLHNGVWTGDTYLLARDGSEIPVSQVIIVHKEPDGQAALFSTIVRDMRVQRQTEEDLRQAQKMEALGRLAGGMAHDFNNLLTVMLGEVELLLEDLPVGHALRHSAEQIRQSGTRAATLTRQLLTFSRRQVLQPELLNLNQVILGLEQLLRRLISEDITLNISLAPDLPLVRTDQGQIEQVVMNLVINARDAMPDGGHLLIETAATLANELPSRREEGSDNCDYALIVVSDTGTGMDEQTKNHLFEPFFTTKPRGKGTGLGLATVHGIVRQSGGHIRFQSEVGQGAIFKIYLPSTTDEGPKQLQLQPQPQPSARLGVVGPSHTRAATVLLVEDDDDVRNLARQILTRQGFTVLEAGDGPTALALAHAYAGPISTLLTDIVMPGGLNGVQLAATLRTLRPDTRIVYMSGYTDNALIDHSIAEEGAYFLQKPFTPDTLVRALLEGLD